MLTEELGVRNTVSHQAATISVHRINDLSTILYTDEFSVLPDEFIKGQQTGVDELEAFYMSTALRQSNRAVIGPFLPLDLQDVPKNRIGVL